jgi:hypothetical protein
MAEPRLLLRTGLIAALDDRRMEISFSARPHPRLRLSENCRMATDDMPLTKKGKSPARLPVKVFQK